MNNWIAEIVLAALFAVAIFLIFAVAYVLGRWECSGKAELMGVEHSYTIRTGCFIKHEGKWIPMKALRGIEEGP